MAETTQTQPVAKTGGSFFPSTPTEPVHKAADLTVVTKGEQLNKPESKPTMVIDANVLIKSGDLQALAQKYNLATVAQAVKEVRDPNARMRLGTIMSSLKIMIPSKEHLAKVSEFAKKTGDCVSISVTDAHLIALAIMLIEQKGHTHMIRSEPARAENFGGDPSQETAEGTIQGYEGDDATETMSEPDRPDPSQNETKADTHSNTSEPKHEEEQQEEVDPDEAYQNADDDDGWMVASGPSKPEKPVVKRERKQTEESISSNPNTMTSKAFTPEVKTPQSEENAHLAPQLWYEDKDFEQDDDEGWITPSNLKDVVQGSEVVEVSQLDSIGVGVMTADFAMQVANNLIVRICLCRWAFHCSRLKGW